MKGSKQAKVRKSRYVRAGEQGSIYKLTVLGGRIYVGQTRQDPLKRVRQHRTKWNVVSHEVLESLGDCDQAVLDEREQWWIKHLRSNEPAIGQKGVGEGADVGPHEMVGATPESVQLCERTKAEMRAALKLEVEAEHRERYADEIRMLEQIRAGCADIVVQQEQKEALERVRASEARTQAQREQWEACQRVHDRTHEIVRCLQELGWTDNEKDREKAYKRLETVFNACVYVASEYTRAAEAGIGEEVFEKWSLKSRCARDFVRLVDTYCCNDWLGRGWLNHVTEQIGRRAFKCTVCQCVIGEHECKPAWRYR